MTAARKNVLPPAPSTFEAYLRLPAYLRAAFDDLQMMRRRFRRVYPSTERLAVRWAVSRSTAKRWLASLRAAGLLVCVYNGGRGRRCIYYVGPRAVDHAVSDNPQWPEKSRFGGLRMGHVVVEQRSRKDLKNEILTAPGSSSTERGTPSESPPSENQAPATPAADEGVPPQPTGTTPPLGGLEATSERRSAPPDEQPTPQSLCPPQSAASGRQLPKGSEKRSVGRVSGRRDSIAKNRPDLWCLSWFLWRAYSSHTPGGPPKDHPADVGAMKALLGAALLVSKGDEDRALAELAWGFRAYVGDREHRFKPLGKLRRIRDGYGRAPADFEAPRRREDAVLGDARTARRAVAELAGGVGKGGGGAPPRPRPPRPPGGGEGAGGTPAPARGNSAEIPRSVRRELDEARGLAAFLLRQVKGRTPEQLAEEAPRLLAELNRARAWVSRLEQQAKEQKP